jgi:hypothetical protein
MSCLDATFTLTPQSPIYWASYNNYAFFWCIGADFSAWSPFDYSSLYAKNQFAFDASYAADPSLPYTNWANLKRSQFLVSYISLLDYANAHKQLVLIFGFETASQARVLVYTDAGLLKDQQLVYPDNQFVLEIDSLDQEFNLYFIHAGGDWRFNGLSGYVA